MKGILKRLIPALLVLALLCACGESVPTQEAQSEAPLLPVTAVPMEEKETIEEISPPAQEELPAQAEPLAETEPPAAAEAAPPAAAEDAPPVDAGESAAAQEAYTCTLSISCATILENKDALAAGKEMLLPDDGWVLAPTEVVFYEGESVFNVLQRTCKQQKIHFEFEYTPLYESVYIEGIYNLYELDCGALSGWKYFVNDEAPNYGCSSYTLSDGDVVRWEYCCDLSEN